MDDRWAGGGQVTHGPLTRIESGEPGVGVLDACKAARDLHLHSTFCAPTTVKGNTEGINVSQPSRLPTSPFTPRNELVPPCVAHFGRHAHPAHSMKAP